MHYPRLSRRDGDHYANRDEQFHVIFNAHPKFGHWPDSIRSMVWECAMDQRSADRVELLVACLMPVHLHLLLSPKGMDIVKFASSWKSYTTRQSWNLGNKNAFWQPRYWDRTIRSEVDLGDVAAYILGNPVSAGFVDDARDWPHSWAWWWEA